MPNIGWFQPLRCQKLLFLLILLYSMLKIQKKMLENFNLGSAKSVHF